MTTPASHEWSSDQDLPPLPPRPNLAPPPQAQRSSRKQAAWQATLSSALERCLAATASSASDGHTQAAGPEGGQGGYLCRVWEGELKFMYAFPTAQVRGGGMRGHVCERKFERVCNI